MWTDDFYTAVWCPERHKVDFCLRKCLYFFPTSESLQSPGANATTVITVRFTVFRKRRLIWSRISHAPGNCLETLPLWKCGLTFKWGTLFKTQTKLANSKRPKLRFFLPNGCNCRCIIYMKHIHCRRITGPRWSRAVRLCNYYTDILHIWITQINFPRGNVNDTDF